MLGLRIQGHEGLGLRRGDWIDPRDLEENLASVRAASAAADLVVFSIHAHQQGRWLTGLAHQVIDAGADVFFAHGPHEVMGIEIYHGRPIIYGPGDFVFQIHQMERFPVEVYSQYGVDPDATIEELRPQLAAKGRLFEQRAAWEAFGAVLRFRAGQLDELRLLPLDLGLDRPLPLRGKPHLADAEFGRRLIAKVGELSRPYGTAVRYLEGENVGVVDLGGRQ